MSLYKRKDSSAWWIKIRLGGRTIQKSSGTDDKIAAQEFHDRVKTELWEQQRLGIKKKRSWREATVRWLLETSKKATHGEDKSKLAWLDPYLGHLMLDDIDQDVIHVIKTAKLTEACEATVNRYLSLVRSILIRARDEWEWVQRSPKIRLFKELNDRERSLTEANAVCLLEELPEHQREIVLFALATGLRQANVLQLEWARVDLQLCHAWIPARKSKNAKPISVPLNAIALAVLHRQVGKHPERVFTFRGRPFSNANTKAWRDALKRAGITDFRWHDLRHTWATWQRRKGTPTHELMRLGGWKTLAMVERYAHVAPDQLAVAASRLDDLFAGYDLATVAGNLRASKLPEAL